MSYLADTNVAARRVLPADPQYGVVVNAIDRLREQGEIIYITPQVLVEFHALATRPLEANGLGLSVAQASAQTKMIEAVFPLLPEIPAIYPALRNLVDIYEVVGRQIYDARLVAVMQAYGITHLLTMNPTHFRRFTSITVIEPKNIA